MKNTVGIKAFFNRAYYLNQLIEANKLELSRLRALAESIHVLDLSEDKVQTSRKGDLLTDVVADIINLEQEIERDVKKFLSAKRRIRKVIYSLKDDKQRLVLYSRYLNFQEFEEIAKTMNYSLRYVYKLRNDGFCSILKSNKLDILFHVESVI